MGKKREEVTDQILGVEFDGVALTKIAGYIEDLLKEVEAKGGRRSSAVIDYQHYGYDGAYEIAVAFRRPETDREYEQRLKVEEKQREQERARKAKAEEKERREFERLKKKFAKEKAQ